MRTARRGLLRWSAIAGVLAVLMSLLTTVVPTPGTPPAHAQTTEPTANLTLTKGAFESGTSTPLPMPVTPGESFDYQIAANCSGLEQGCIGAVTTDVLPPDINFVGFVADPNFTVSFDATTHTVTITYTQALPSPPNPANSIGIEAGSTRLAVLHVQLSPTTTASDGQTITNTANATADNTNDADASTDITVHIPTVITPVATKAINPTSMVAQSQTAATVTLGVRNASTGAPDVTSLTVADTTATTWNSFDLASVGPVTYPPGADQVSVGICTATPPCAPGDFLNEPPQTGSTISLPPGLDPTTVTGIQFTFSNTVAGTPLPPSSTGGTVAVGLTLRDTDRSTGAIIDPTTNLTQQNCATPSAIDTTAGMVTGANSCVNYTILPGIVGVAVSKQIFPDANGSFTNNGFPVTGQTPPSGVTAVTTATNTSAFSVTNLTITDPSTTSPSNFADVNPTSLQLTFPTGATGATGTVTCSDGTVVPFTATPTARVVPNVTCPPGTTGTSVTVTFTGSIPPNASGQVAVHAVLTSAAVGGDVLTDCSDAQITGGTGSAATGTGCNSLTLQSPSVGVGGTKTNTGNAATGNQLVPGENFTFTMTAQNHGNLPVDSFEMADPSDPPPTANNPFSVLTTITSATVSVTPATTPAPTFAIEVFNGTTWVPFTPGVVGSTGIRVRLTSGLVIPNQTVTFTLGTTVSSTAAPGTTIQNCQITTIGQAQGTSTTGSVCSPVLTVQGPSTAGQVGKAIVPNTLTAPVPGSAPTAQVQLRAANIGNLPLSRIVITDPDPTQPTSGDFFDHVDLVSLGGVNFPPGSNRVEVDGCLSITDCQNGTYTLGTPGTTAVLPPGVAAGSVAGLRFTFTNASGGFVLNPGSNFPATGACPSATVCFSVVPRTTQRSTGAPITFPETLTDFATAGGESPISGGNLVSFGPVQANLTVNPGIPQLGVAKSASPATVPPGTDASYTLTTTDTGTAPIPGLTITEPLPAGLEFNSSFIGTAGQPYTITVTEPAGAAPVPTPTFTITPGTPGVSGDTLVWQWPANFLFEPTSTITLGFEAAITPGTPGGTAVPNTYAAGSSDAPTMAALACSGGAPKDPTLGCEASASVTAGFGSDSNAQKWVHGDDSRGFLNTLTGAVVAPSDPSCPDLTIDGNAYTRFPCVAQVLAGENFTFAVEIQNAGTTPLDQTRLVDDLPKLGDTGVIVPGQRGTQWDPRPTLAGAPSLLAGAPGDLTVSYSNTSPACITDLSVPPVDCPPAAWADPLSPDVQAFRAFVNFPTPLPPGGTTTILIPMSAPADLTTPPNQLPIAWNSFAHSDFFTTSGGSEELGPVEPEKVGVAMPFGTLQIDKVVTGPLPPGSVVGPFTFTYTCSVTTAEGVTDTIIPTTTTTVGPVTMPATGPGTASADVAHPPQGAVCTVTETNNEGAASSTLSPRVVTIGADVNPSSPSPTVATATNDYPTPPSLIVTKAVTGTAAGLVSGPWTIRVVCPGPTATSTIVKTLTFNAPGSQAVTGIPVGRACNVTEPENGGATNTGIVYDPGPSGPVTILPNEDVTATVTNTYDQATLPVTKIVTGPGPAGPYTFTASCHLVSNAGTDVPVTLAPSDAAFTLSNGQTHNITAPVNAICTVSETNAPTGATVTYQVSRPNQTRDQAPTSGPVTVDGQNSLTVTNDFAPGTLQIDKAITGPIPAGSLIGPFAVSYTCNLTTSTGSVPFIPPTAATIGAVTTPASPSPVVVHNIPAGAVCTVTETDSGGATSTVSPGSVTIVADTDPAAPSTVTVTNTFAARSLIVTKAVTGAAAGMVSGPFSVQVDCVTAGGAPISGFPQTLTFGSAGSRTLANVPIGAKCTVSEPDNHGAVATIKYAPGAPGGPVMIPATTDATATVTNTYDPASLSITKAVVGQGPAGPYLFRTSCHLASNTGQTIPVSLPAADTTFSISAGQSHVINNIPVGAICTVSELNAPSGDTVTYNGSATGGTVILAGNARVAVTNTFAALTATPPPAATPPPPAPAAPPPVAPAPQEPFVPPSVGGPLAVTGANLRGLVGDGITLIVLGAGITLLAHRRRRS